MKLKIYMYVILSCILFNTCGFSIDVIKDSHDARCTVFDDYGAEQSIKRPKIDRCSNIIEEVLSDERRVSVAKLERKEAEKNAETIFKAVFATAVTDLMYDETTFDVSFARDQRTHKKPYSAAVTRTELRDHFLILERFDQLSYAIMGRVRYGFQAIDELFLTQFGSKYNVIYELSGMSKQLVAGWLSDVMTSHRNGLRQIRNAVQWVNDLKGAIVNNRTRIVPQEQLSGCHQITTFTDRNGKSIARREGRLGSELALSVAAEIGLVSHLAPTVVIDGLRYEKFIRLFDDEESERELLKNDTDAGTLASFRGVNGDLTVMRLFQQCGQTEEGLSLATCLLKNIHSDSIDELFLHHIITSASDSAPRNFLLRYKGAKLCLVRIDYSDSIMQNSAHFLGERTTGFFGAFGARGRDVISKLPRVSVKDELWNAKKKRKAQKEEENIKVGCWYSAEEKQQKIEESKAAVDKEYNDYRDRIRALIIMNEAGFFASATRGETMSALAYVGFYDGLTQKIDKQFTDPYVINRCVGSNPMIDFCRTLRLIKDEMYESIIEKFNYYVVDYSTPRAPFKDEVVQEAVNEWLSTPNKLKLRAIKPFLPCLKSIIKRHVEYGYISKVDDALLHDVDADYNPFEEFSIT